MMAGPVAAPCPPIPWTKMKGRRFSGNHYLSILSEPYHRDQAVGGILVVKFRNFLRIFNIPRFPHRHAPMDECHKPTLRS